MGLAWEALSKCPFSKCIKSKHTGGFSPSGGGGPPHLFTGKWLPQGPRNSGQVWDRKPGLPALHSQAITWFPIAAEGCCHSLNPPPVTVEGRVRQRENGAPEDPARPW